jgi:hypothetical protein
MRAMRSRLEHRGARRIMRDSMSYKFSAGQMVRLAPTLRNRGAASASYKVVRPLPAAEDGERCYRIKSANEPHERVAKESEMERA